MKSVQLLLATCLAVTEILCVDTDKGKRLHYPSPQHVIENPITGDDTNTLYPVSFETRAYWMRVALQALSQLRSPCPFAAYGTAIVNHTSDGGLGSLVCIGANAALETGNPALHGEIAAINNCTSILGDPNGSYKLSPSEVGLAWRDLSLYTTAEACPMCASAIRWVGFREYIYGTSLDTLIENGWGQIRISSGDVFSHSELLGTKTEFVGTVLSNETDPYLFWQYRSDYPCPTGCSRQAATGTCSQGL